MNKRKLLLVALALSMVAILAVGGTLAYFTDTADAVNTFTIGKVNIELIEQQRNYDWEIRQQMPDSGLEPFEGDKKLFPIVGSAQGDKDNMGLPIAKNYLDKIITVKADWDSEECYIRVFVAVPAALDDPDDAGNNVLHFNLGNKFETGDYKASDYANWGTWEFVEACEISGDDIVTATYNVYCFTYSEILSKNEETASACVVGFYMDEKVDFDGKDYTIAGNKIAYDFTNGVTIPVFAQGIQADGFASAADAFAASGLPTNPWAE